MGASPSLFLITEVVLPWVGAAMVLLYIVVPESSAQSIIGLGCLVVMGSGRYQGSTIVV